MLKIDNRGIAKRTKIQTLAFARFKKAMTRLERHLLHPTLVNQLVPVEWSEIHKDYEQHKTRITIRLDKSVVKFFRSTGPGYQVRIDEVLQCYVQAKVANLIRTLEEDVASMDESEMHLRHDAQQDGRLEEYLRGA